MPLSDYQHHIGYNLHTASRTLGMTLVFQAWIMADFGMVGLFSNTSSQYMVVLLAADTLAPVATLMNMNVGISYST